MKDQEIDEVSSSSSGGSRSLSGGSLSFTPLSHSPPCHLLTIYHNVNNAIDEKNQRTTSPPSSSTRSTSILIDCGLNVSLVNDEERLKQLLTQLQTIGPSLSAILLTYPDTEHLGLLPYLATQCSIQCPIYATVPVYNMGQLFLYDFFESLNDYRKFDIFNLDDVDFSFECIHKVKYLENVVINDMCTIYALNAGHMIGGSIWRLILDSGESIVYSMLSNHKMEHHLDPGALNLLDFRPNLLICDGAPVSPQLLLSNPPQSDGTSSQNLMISKHKINNSRLMESLLVKELQETLRQGGSVMMPCDTSGRVIEIAYILNKEWSKLKNNLIPYNLVLLNHVAYNALEFAKAHVEWCGKRMPKEIEKSYQNPLSMNFVITCHNIEELLEIPKPIALLVSSADLESGFSRFLLPEWCDNPANKIIFMQQPSGDPKSCTTLANFLLKNPNITEFEMQINTKSIEKANDLNANMLRVDDDTMAPDLTQIDLDPTDQIADEIPDKIEIGSSAIPRHQEEVDIPDKNADIVEKSKSDVNSQKTTRMDDMTDVIKINQIKNPFTNRISFPCFSFLSKKVRWDDYGEIIQGFIGANDSRNDIKTSKNPKDDHEKQLLQQILTEINEEKLRKYQYFSRKQKIHLKCSIKLLDFSGVSDFDSFKRILGRLRPEKIIVSTCVPEVISHMRDFVSANLAKSCTMYSPKCNESIKIDTDANYFYANLTREIFNNFNFRPILNNILISPIKARIYARNSKQQDPMSSGDTNVPKSHELQSLPKGNAQLYELATDIVQIDHLHDNEEVDMIEEEATESDNRFALLSRDPIGKQKLYFGTPKLSVLKSHVVKSGMSAEFVSGALIIKNKVSLCKKEGNNYVLDGFLCPEYFKTRSLLYSHFIDA
ncbi:MAG: cleavage and polyadenylation specificity factor subunit 2 [Marteilia pararefringens]